jgi:hypothetical protein
MKPKITLYKNGCSAHMERLPSGMYEVKILTRTSITDRIRLDCYKSALEYYRACKAIAKNHH